MQLFNLCLFFFEGTCQGLILWLSLTKRVSWRQGHFLNLISDRRAVCTGALELSCTFYPELFPPTILCNHLCVLLRLCDLTQHSYYQGQQSKKKKKLPTFIAKQALLYTLATWLMKMSENPEKNMTWSHTSFIGKLMIPGLRITAFHWLLNTLPHPQ